MVFNFLQSLAHDPEIRGATIGKQLFFILAALIVFCSIMSACTGVEPATQEEVKMVLSLSSTAFEEEDKIPVTYTCDGQDISPPLVWGDPPQVTGVFALIVDDPDAPGGVFTHWVLFNLPATFHQLGEGIPAQEQLENGTLQGKNDFSRIGYGGPCPPHGRAHRYRFTIYALDQSVDLKPGSSKKQLLDAMKGHILAQGQLIGTYQR